jgi:hypothetical protein
MRSTTTTGTITIMICICSDLFAGAWTRDQQSFYAKLSFTTLNSDQFHTKDGDKITTADFQTWSLNLYGEYGIINNLTAVVRFPFVRSAAFETTESFTGIGDIGVGLKYRLVSGSTPIAVGLHFELPSGNENGSGALKDLPGASVRLPTGDGELNTRWDLYLSHSFYPTPAYASLDAGYNIRTEGFTDEYLIVLQGGYKFIPVMWAQASIKALGPVSTPDPALAGGAALGFGEGVQYTAYSIGTAYEISPHLIVSFDIYSAFGRITNIYSGLNLVFGIALEY